MREKATLVVASALAFRGQTEDAGELVVIRPVFEIYGILSLTELFSTVYEFLGSERPNGRGLKTIESSLPNF